MPRLSREDWCRAALFALAEGGVRAVSVEGIARTLGVTKGSFYWHFKNRDALVEAALEHWALAGTHALIATLDALPDPAERLEALLAAALRDVEEMRAEAALMAAAAAGDPLIAPVFESVNAARLAYLTDQYSALGVDDPSAWATVCYASYLGAVQLAAMQPSPITAASAPGLVSVLKARLVPGA